LESFLSSPPQLESRLRQKFDADYRSTEGHGKLLGRMLTYQIGYMALRCCVNNTVYYERAVENTWNTSDRNFSRTCDYCIKTMRSCARLVQLNGVVKLVIYPVPDYPRRGIIQDELVYWV
jgi:hypothetical protein